MIKKSIKKLTQHERINFLLTNRIPRRYATFLMGWFSKIESPMLTRISLFFWRLFADDLNLEEAKQSRFNSLHDCFIRELKEGARIIDPDPDIITSPCDAIIGAHGKIKDTQVIQAKDFPYELLDLLGDQANVNRYRDGVFVTLRLKSTMYHRFHAPCDCRVKQVNYISGDTWNVNPIALKNVEELYCKNERAVIDLDLDRPGSSLSLVPVAAILVASIRLKFLDTLLHLRYKGPNQIACDASFQKGDEMGYFQHGSTIIVFGTSDFEIDADVFENKVIRMGQALLRSQKHR